MPAKIEQFFSSRECAIVSAALSHVTHLSGREFLEISLLETMLPDSLKSDFKNVIDYLLNIPKIPKRFTGRGNMDFGEAECFGEEGSW